MSVTNDPEEEQFSLKKLFIPFTTGKALHFLIIIGLVIFGNGLFNIFVGDDNTQIVDNPAVHTLANVPAFFFTNRLDNAGSVKLGALYFKPLLDTSYALTYSLFGLNFFGYHLFQLILYITNACLVYFFFKQYFRKSISFLLASLFLIHPINSENALYIADTQEVLFIFFGMTGLLLLQNFKKPRNLILASVCLFFSLLSKETGVLFLLVAPLYLFLKNKRSAIILLVASSFIFALYALLRIHAIGLAAHTLINAPIGRLSLQNRLLNIPAVIFFYLQTFFFPLNLSSSWQWIVTQTDFAHFFLPISIDLAVMIGLVGTSVWLVKKQHKQFGLFVFFSAWLVAGLFFHAQVMPLDQTVAERWFYFPMIGLLGIMGILGERFKLRLRNQYVMTAVICILLLFSGRSFVRTFDYRNDFTLATHDIQVAPDSYNFEYIISHTYYQAGLLPQAELHAKRSVALFPYITNYTNLGAVESRMGNYKAAKEAYVNALKYGQDALPYENLASLSFVYGDPKENSNFIKHVALKKYPQNGTLWFDLAIEEYTHGMHNEARQDWEMAKKYNKIGNLAYFDSIITQDKPLSLKIKDGNVMFVTH